MNLKKLLIIALLFLLHCSLNAHSVILQIYDNEDGTIEIFGGFSNGASAAGAKLLIKSQITSKVLFETRVPKSGSLTITIPKEPYSVILDSGPGHKLEKSGIIEPEEGFKNLQKQKPLNLAFISTLGLSFLFILLALLLNFKKRKELKTNYFE